MYYLPGIWRSIVPRSRRLAWFDERLGAGTTFPGAEDVTSASVCSKRVSVSSMNLRPWFTIAPGAQNAITCRFAGIMAWGEGLSMPNIST